MPPNPPKKKAPKSSKKPTQKPDDNPEARSTPTDSSEASVDDERLRGPYDGMDDEEDLAPGWDRGMPSRAHSAMHRSGA